MAEIKKIEKNAGSRQTNKAEREQQRKKTTGAASRLMTNPETLNREDVIQAQREVGNQVVQRGLDPNFAKDKETEGALSNDLSEKIQRKRGTGSALPEQVRRAVGKQLGHDLSGVRIHTDGEADKLTRSVQARAFTIGNDIFFKNGVYAPDSEKGRETIVHELTHVVQQSTTKGVSGRLTLGAPDTSMEKEADKTGKKFAAMSFKASQSAAGNAGTGTVQRSMPEEEEPLQAQRDPIVQRQGVEEEEPIQTQRDPMIQRQGVEEEEPIQMQRDPMVQRQEEEEELQMQPDPMVQRQEEEEELQMQPDPMIQRDLLEEIKAERLRRLQTGGRKKHNEQVEKLEEGHNKLALDPKVISTAKVDKGQAEQKAKALGEKAKDMGIGSKKNLSNLGKLDESREKKDKKDRENLFKEEKEDKKTKSRNQLMDTIKNKNSSTDDVKAAQEKLDSLHKRGKWDTFKSTFTPGKTSKSYSEQAMQSRKIGLKGAAEAGDDKAFEKYKTEKGERKKNSKTTKVLGALGSAGKGLAGMAGGLIAKQLGSYKEHFFGKKEEKEEAPKSGGSSSENVGAGSVGMMEKYGDLVRKNEDLKRRLAKYESSE